MKRVFQFAGAVLAVLLIGASAAFLWASSGPVPEDQLTQITDYPAPPASADRDTFTVMTYNLGHLAGPDGDVPTSDSLFRANMDRAVDLIRRADPDIIGFQEIDFGSPRFGGLHPLDTIATKLRYASGAKAVNWNERYLPYTPFGRVQSGQALLSRYSLRQQVRAVLPRPSSQSFFRDAFYFDRLAQVSVADIGGWPLILMNVHLEASDRKTREKQARKVNDLYNRLEKYGFPILLFGNLNSVRPSAKSALPRELQRQFAGDETMELLVGKTPLMPAFSEGAYVTGASIGTYPADDPTLKIDYIFYRPKRIIPIDSGIWCNSSQPPSDHCAVTMSFLLPRPKEKLPEKQIPDSKLPSLDSLINAASSPPAERESK